MGNWIINQVVKELKKNQNEFFMEFPIYDISEETWTKY